MGQRVHDVKKKWIVTLILNRINVHVYNKLVQSEWIFKERPLDDERTVIIHLIKRSKN